MKLTIRADLENTPIKSAFEIDLPEKYGTLISESGRIIAVVAEAVERIREALQDDRNSSGDKL